jgi:crossover junction endodeoxyribonuclease RuvC
MPQGELFNVLKESPMRILGIDPGLRITGYGCVDLSADGHTSVIEAGVIRVPTSDSLERRLHHLHRELESVLADLQPEHMAVESLFTHPRHLATGVRMGHARGVILLAGAARDLQVMELPPAEVKKSLTGNGRADKRRMQLAITAQCQLAEVPEPPDVADALAIAICAARRLEFDLRRTQAAV